MCRQAAFPPGTTREEAHSILAPFFWGNQDGFGYCFVKDGRFMIYKNELGYMDAYKKGALGDLPKDSWTICHLRAASAGAVAKRNTHPFIHGDYALTHNGHSGSLLDLRKDLNHLGMAPAWEGETDSEVAAYLVSQKGPEEFAKSIVGVGAFLILTKTGQLFAVVAKGSFYPLEYLTREGRTVVASDFRGAPKAIPTKMGSGYIQFDKAGEVVRKEYEPPRVYTYYESGTESADFCGVEVKPRGSPNLPKKGADSLIFINALKNTQKVTVDTEGRLILMEEEPANQSLIVPSSEPVPPTA